MGDGEKLLTYLNSAFKALLGFDIFPRVPKKKSEIFLPSIISVHTCGSISDKRDSQSSTTSIQNKDAQNPDTGMRRITMFRSKTDRIYDGGPLRL